MDVASVLSHWPVSQLMCVQPVHGTNNLSWRVDATSGQYVLRVYQNAGNIQHVAYEHALLGMLQTMGLSFAVPTPISSFAGRSLEPIGDGQFASLFHRIPGRHPQRGNVIHASAVGAALGELDAALVRVELPAHSSAIETYGDFVTQHPPGGNLNRLLGELPLDSDERGSFSSLLSIARASVPGLYEELPRQVIHSDIACSNVLMEAGRVTGILDFEFAGQDIRAMDLAVGFLQCACDVTGTGLKFQQGRVRAFTSGYIEHVQLQAREITALPDLLRLRKMVSILHRMGRWKAELASDLDVVSRVREALSMEAWLQTHADELMSWVT